MTATNFAVILPAYNEEAHIGGAIDAVRACESDGVTVEIVIVDNLSTDRTVDVAEERGVAVLTNDTGERMSIASLRNAGARATTAPLLAFLDADMLVPQDWLSEAGKRFTAGYSGALGYAGRSPDDAPWVGRIWGNRADGQKADMSTDFLPGRNILVTREAFDSVGGFDETLTTCEDKDFTYRLRKAGFPVLRVPSSSVIHQGCERGLAEFIRKEFWRQSTTLAFARRHGYPMRTLRNPVMSAWHMAMLLFFAGAVVWGGTAPALTAAALWLAPTALFTLRDAMTMSRREDVPGVFALTFLRWNVSGVALAWQLFRLMHPLKGHAP